MHAGAFDAALGLLAEAEAVAIDDRPAWPDRAAQEARSSTHPIPEPRRRLSCWRPPGRSSRSTSSSRGRPTSTPGWRRSLPGPHAAARRAAAGGVEGGAMPLRRHRTRAALGPASWTVSRRWSPMAEPPSASSLRTCSRGVSRRRGRRPRARAVGPPRHVGGVHALGLAELGHPEPQARRARSAVRSAGAPVDRAERTRRLRRVVRRLRGDGRARRRVRRGQRRDRHRVVLARAASCRPPTRVGRRRSS